MALVAVITLVPPGEPSHKGRTLSQWLALVDSEQDQYDTEGPVAEAIRAMGIDALPLLVSRISTRDSSVHGKFDETLVKLDMRKPSHPFESYMDRMVDRLRLQSEAIAGIRFLGTNAHSAIPEFTDMLINDEDASMAAHALGAMGPKGVDVLLEHLERRESRIKKHCLYGLGARQGNDTRNVEALLEYADHPEQGRVAFRMLGCCRGDPSRILPILTNALVNGDQDRQYSAIVSLGFYGAEAKPAIPLLRSNTNRNFRSAIDRTLHSIESEIADGSGNR